MITRFASTRLAPTKSPGRDRLARQPRAVDYEPDQDEFEEQPEPDEDEEDEKDDEVEDEADLDEEEGSAELDPDMEDEEDEENQPDQDADEEAEPDGYGSLAELAVAIDEAHQKSRRGHELSNQHALRAGEYLLVVKRRVGHGQFGQWVAANVQVSHRQAERYLELHEGREELEELNAQWQSLWSVSEALARLGELRHGEDHDDGEPGPDASAQTPDQEADGEQEDEQEDEVEDESVEDQDPRQPEEPAPRLTAKQLRQAKAAHRQRVKQLPKFLKAGPIKFGRNSAGLAALREVGAAFVKAARHAARRLHSPELAEQGFDLDLVAMALVELLPQKLPVAKLFEPGSSCGDGSIST